MMTTITSISNNSTITVALTPAINSESFSDGGYELVEVPVIDGKAEVTGIVTVDTSVAFLVSLAITVHDPYPLIV
jgi:hypothetical protein